MDTCEAVKRCNDCGAIKPLGEFYARRDRNSVKPYCKECWKLHKCSERQGEYQRRHGRKARLSLRARIAELKRAPCKDCGRTFPAYCMDFDHVDPSQKLIGIASEVSSSRSRSKKHQAAIFDELEKCDLVCANCHRERTYRRGGLTQEQRNRSLEAQRNRRQKRTPTGHVQRCSRCKAEKDLCDYYPSAARLAKAGKASSGYIACRDCCDAMTKESAPARALRNKLLIAGLKSKPCADCRIQYPQHVMDFDHRIPEIKNYQADGLVRLSMSTIRLEAAKCDVVCANCHRERTNQQRGGQWPT